MLLEATHLSKQFGRHQALHDINLDVAPGEIVGFLGPNGAGKTTTMRILAGCLSSDGGSARIDGHDVVAEPLACRRLVGYLPQEPPLYPDMTVVGYLDHVARLKLIPAGVRRRAVVAALEEAGVAGLETARIGKLSGGTRQRVGLAQALLGDPRLLILDEPTAGFDPAQVARFRERLRQLGRDRGILLSTHILAEVEAVCARVVLINHGHNLLSGSIADLRARAALRQRLRLRMASSEEAAHCLQGLQGLPWLRSLRSEEDTLILELDDQARPELVQQAARHGRIRELVEERCSLEEVFRELVDQTA